MERKATFAVKQPTPNSSAHNSRRSVPKYLIETDPSFDKNYYERLNFYQDDKQFRTLAQSIFKTKIRQTMQSKQVKALIKETVVTAKAEHTAEDIKSLFDALREKMGGGYYLLELAGHFDEGHVERVEEGWENLTYYPSTDILLKGDGNWYIKKDELKSADDEDDFDVLADMRHFKKVHNIHWHCKFTHMNLGTGKTARFTKGQVSGDGRLKFVAKFLGLRYEPKEKINIGQTVESVKEQHRKRRQEKCKQITDKRRIVKEKELQLEMSESMLKASRANHKEDSEFAFEMSVENRCLNRELETLNEYVDGLEEELKHQKAAYRKLLAEINMSKTNENVNIIKDNHGDERISIPSILNR